jgi:8-oxo-dGTP diphosphatase
VFHAYPTFDLVMLVYACRITAGRPQPVQVAAINWVTPAALPDLELLPADYPLARALAAAQ